MQQLRRQPTDEQALHDLERAIQALKERAPDKNAVPRVEMRAGGRRKASELRQR